MGLPPSYGALHVSVAEAAPGTAVTVVGAAGAVVPPTAGRSSRVAASHTVLAPVLMGASGVAPRPTTASSVSNSTSPVPEMFERWVNPGPALSVAPNPEST